jgi:GNAT superfamily N-acetyltransferase
MLFSDHALSCRLEAAEGYACREFAMGRRRLFPESGSEAIRVAGADVAFDGPDSPITQTFGLGLFEPPASQDLEAIEEFFQTRGAPTQHEISPFAGAVTLQLLCARGYRPIEVSHVLYRPIELLIEPSARIEPTTHIRVRVINHKEAALWSEVNVRGWTHEHPEFEPFIRDTGAVFVNRENSPCFIAEIDGQACAAGALAIHEGVALFAGASTVPEFRRRGLQTALLEARMRFACEQGCDLAMMVTEPGSNSQRNAQRQGFVIAYTRLKWQKRADDAD